MEKDDFTRKLKDRLTGFESGIPPGAWAAFEEHRRQKEDKRPIAGWWLLAVFVLLIGGIGIGVWRGYQVKNKAHSLSGLAVKAQPVPPAPNEAEETGRAAVRDAGLENVADRRVGGRKAPHSSTTPLPSVSDTLSVILPSEVGRSPGFLEPLPFSNQQLSLPLPDITIPGTPEAEARRKYAVVWGGGFSFQTNFTRASQNRSFPGLMLTAGFPVTQKLMIRAGLSAGRSAAVVENKLPQLGGSGVKWLNKGVYRWWNVDVPLEVQYNFVRKPSSAWYAAIGLTSSVNWREHYEEQYRDDRTILTTVVLENGEIREVESLVTEVENRTGNSNEGPRWQPLTFVNASVGIQRRFSPRMLILAEPFVRYPVTGVTSRHLKFTSLGIQLKVSFQRP